MTLEIAPTKFLDTRIVYSDDGSISTEVYRKPTKLPVTWNSKIPKRYKRNTINTELHRAWKIASHFDREISLIKLKFTNAGFPIKFIESVVRDFQSKIENEDFIIPPWLMNDDDDDELLIPSWLFEVPKKFVLIELPFSSSNELISKHFLKKLHRFTNDKYNIVIKWNTRKVKSLFPLKDRNPHPSNVIYRGDCICGESYVGETVRNAEVRWSEHGDPKKKSEPSAHIDKNIEHEFTWRILARAPKLERKRKILEAFFIAKLKPSLNEQVVSHSLSLFRHGVT